MPEYIERESLLEDIKQYSHARIDYDAIDKMGFQFVKEMCSIQRIIEKQPAADVVEVVRCKNCKHWHEDTGWCYHHSHFMGDKGEFCHPWESANWKMFDGDDYCSDGERKEGAEE